jgi:hypothetical protein
MREGLTLVQAFWGLGSELSWGARLRRKRCMSRRRRLSTTPRRLLCTTPRRLSTLGGHIIMGGRTAGIATEPLRQYSQTLTAPASAGVARARDLRSLSHQAAIRVARASNGT